jgi:capsular exopolysaccharide synthesis family protein
MDRLQYLHAVRTYWWAVVLPVVLAVAIGAFVASRAEPDYRASVTFFVATSTQPAGQSAVQGDEFAQRRVNSYLGLLSTDRLADKVIDESGLDLAPSQIKQMMGADSDVDTLLVTATITHESQELVGRVAQAVSSEFVDLVDEVENRGSGRPAVQLEVVSGPNVTKVPPRRAVAVGVPAAIGLVAGLGLAWLLEVRDKTIRSEAQLRELEQAPVLGMVPFDRRLREGPRARRVAASSAGLEAFRQLRTNLEFIDVGSPVQILEVTSPVAEEGKTTTAVNLASALVAANRRVLIVEADLRRPTLGEYFKLRGAMGLTDVIVRRAEIDTAMHPVGINGLMLLPSGKLPPNPSELLGSDAMVQLMESLRDRFDVIIINTPPLLPITDAAVLAAHADGVLVVVRAGRTTRQQLSLAMRALHAVGARVLGTVLNMAPTQRDSSYEAYWQAGPVGADRSGREVDVPADGSGRGSGRPEADELIGRAAPAPVGRMPDTRP